jgi:hypothetical protein
MRTIIAGSREGVTYEDVIQAVELCGWLPSTVICGGARGADALGEAWAESKNVPIEYFPADWNRYGRSAGPIRNSLMAQQSEALIAVWDGFSRGTKNMIELAAKHNLRIYIHRIKTRA